MSTEETITVTLPLDVAKRFPMEDGGTVGTRDWYVLRNAIKASLPKPKSPEQIIEEAFRRRHHLPCCPECVTGAANDLRSEGWLRDTPEKPRAD